jgi:hypothetical protein
MARALAEVPGRGADALRVEELALAAFTPLQRALDLAEPLARRDPADVDEASVVGLSRAGLGVAHASLAMAAPAGEGRDRQCDEARRWGAASGPEMTRLESLRTLNGWKRWLAHRSAAAVAQ